MNAIDLHRHLITNGFRLTVDGESLRVAPASKLDEALRREIATHKAGLLALLQAPPPLTAPEREDITESIEERAAIREYDGALPRHDAETQAASAMRVYRLLIAMGEGEPPKWATMLAPGCDLAEAEHGARTKFGARLLEILPHSATGAPFTTET